MSFAPHFYGELAKTPQGIDILKQSAHIEHFVETIKNPRATWIDRRAALWSIGQIGSSPLGFELLCKSDIIEFISHEAFNCTTLSMRGTCFYIVGLLSATSQARNMLSRLGWDFPLNKELCIAVPKDVKKFLSVPDDESILSWPLDPKNLYGVSKVPANTNKPVVKITSESFGPTILGNISNLGNNVTQKSSHSALLKMRQRYPHYFQSTALFFETSKLFSCYSLRLPARRFVWFDLFDQVDFSVKGLAALDENNTETNENVKYIESE